MPSSSTNLMLKDEQPEGTAERGVELTHMPPANLPLTVAAVREQESNLDKKMEELKKSISSLNKKLFAAVFVIIVLSVMTSLARKEMNEMNDKISEMESSYDRFSALASQMRSEVSQFELVANQTSAVLNTSVEKLGGVELQLSEIVANSSIEIQSVQTAIGARLDSFNDEVEKLRADSTGLIEDSVASTNALNRSISQSLATVQSSIAAAESSITNIDVYVNSALASVETSISAAESSISNIDFYVNRSLASVESSISAAELSIASVNSSNDDLTDLIGQADISIDRMTDLINSSISGNYVSRFCQSTTKTITWPLSTKDNDVGLYPTCPKSASKFVQCTVVFDLILDRTTVMAIVGVYDGGAIKYGWRARLSAGPVVSVSTFFIDLNELETIKFVSSETVNTGSGSFSSHCQLWFDEVEEL